MPFTCGDDERPLTLHVLQPAGSVSRSMKSSFENDIELEAPESRMIFSSLVMEKVCCQLMHSHVSPNLAVSRTPTGNTYCKSGSRTLMSSSGL